MHRPDDHKWIRLTLRFEQNIIVVAYEDGNGRKVSAYEEGHDERRLYTGVFWVPRKMNAYVAEMAAAFPTERRTRQGVQPVPLAVFLEWDGPEVLLRATLAGLPYEYVIWELLDRPQFAFQPCLYWSGTARPAPFELPARIRFTGKGAEKAIKALENTWWYTEFESIASHGLDLKVNDQVPSAGEETIDILVVSADAITQYHRALKKNQAAIPRLLVVNAQDKWHLFEDPAWQPVPAIVSFYGGKDLFPLFLKSFFYGIIHDYPLHEAVADADAALRNEGKHLYFATRLFASPESNQDLRLADALRALKERMARIQQSNSPGNWQAFLDRIARDKPMPKQLLSDHFASHPIDSWFFDDVRGFSQSFTREIGGLRYMAQSNKIFDTNKTRLFQIHDTLQQALLDPGLRNLVRKHQARQVEVMLEELEDTLAYVPLNRGAALRRDGRYRLNVFIGHPTLYSLMKGPGQPIDPLLPDPEGSEGYRLHIVVFPKDFQLQSPSVVEVYLPLLGGSETAQFYLAPHPELRRQELRIMVFHQDNLLQSFLLEASVGREDALVDDEGVTVTLDSGNTSRFANLDSLQPRDLFIGINSDGQGTHTLFLKKGANALQVKGLTETLMAQKQKEFRDLLQQAYFTNGTTRFTEKLEPVEEPGEAFKAQVRLFAGFGSQCYDVLFQSAEDELGDGLTGMRAAGAAQKITIKRYNINYAFPWPMLYDLPFPGKRKRNSAPVCTGKPFDEATRQAFQSAQHGCSHNPGVECYCLEGFWGYRNEVEQLLPGHKEDIEDAATQVRLTDATRILFSRNQEDKPTESLQLFLEGHTPAAVTVSTENDLVDELWNDEKRPEILIVLGHMDTDDNEEEPDGPRILTFPRTLWTESAGIPDSKWICNELLKLRYHKKWPDGTKPLIFLVSCSSTDVNVASDTTLLGCFRTAGASAIIGTECQVTTSLGEAFVRFVIEGMFARHWSLGAAIRAFNQQLAQSGNPMAFVFTCYGNSDLVVQYQNNETSTPGAVPAQRHANEGAITVD